GRPEETLTFGTPPYVAPERIAGAEATGATDVYALGVLLFESLTGTVPFGTSWDDLTALSEDDRRPPPLDVPGLPPAVAAICRRCLSLDPSARPTAAEVHATLTKVAEGRHFRWWIPVAAALLVAAVLSVVLVANRQSGEPSASPSNPVAPAPSPIVTSIYVTPSPSFVPSQLPEELTPAQAAAAVDEVIARRAKAGEIRPDVVNDLRNQLNDLKAHPTNPDRRIASLRQQLQERERQHALSAAARDELDQALVRLGAALAR